MTWPASSEEMAQDISGWDFMYPKILLVHNTAMPYRVPFFELLYKNYKVFFVFTQLINQFKLRGMMVSKEIGCIDDSSFTILNKTFFLHSLLQFLSILLKSDYDLIVSSIDYLPPSSFVYNFLCFLIGKLRGKKIIFWNEEWLAPRHFLRYILGPAINIIIHGADVILVPGTKHRKYIISLGALPKKVFIVPNVSNLRAQEIDVNEKNNLIVDMGIKGKKIVLYVGQLKPSKGVQYLIPAFAKIHVEIPNIVLILIGCGKYKAHLKDLSRKYNVEDSVIFTGFVDDNSLRNYYSLCDLCIVPSIIYSGFSDPWVLVVNEAMAFGKPIIATTAVGAAFDMIEGNGCIVPEKDSEALYRSMKILLSNPLLIKTMGIKSKEIIKNYTYCKMFNGFKDAILFSINEDHDI